MNPKQFTIWVHRDSVPLFCLVRLNQQRKEPTLKREWKLESNFICRQMQFKTIKNMLVNEKHACQPHETPQRAKQNLKKTFKIPLISQPLGR